MVSAVVVLMPGVVDDGNTVVGTKVVFSAGRVVNVVVLTSRVVKVCVVFIPGAAEELIVVRTIVVFSPTDAGATAVSEPIAGVCGDCAATAHVAHSTKWTTKTNIVKKERIVLIGPDVLLCLNGHVRASPQLHNRQDGVAAAARAQHQGIRLR